MVKKQQAAVALGYNPQSPNAPKVLASGLGEIAKKILEVARENDVHIHQDDNLAQLLAQVPLGSEIPEEAYQLVAELLSFLYQTDAGMAEKIAKK